MDPSLCLRVTSLGVPQSVCDTDTVAIDVKSLDSLIFPS